MRRWRNYANEHVGQPIRAEDDLRIQAFLEEHQPRVLLAQFGPTGVLMRRSCVQANVPLFVYFRGNDATGLARKPSIRRQYRRLFPAAAGVIATSAFLAERLAAMGCPREKLHVCPSGVDAARFTITAREPGRILAVGRLVEKKGPEQTLRAFAKLRTRMPQAHLDLIGDGPLRKRCLHLIEELGLADSVTFHGRLAPDSVAALFAHASIYAQHSVEAANGDCEGTPVSVLEAMASGLPVAATRHSGIGEVVLDGETGFLCAEHDVDGMAEAMAKLLADPARAEAMGLAGRRRVEENFTHAHVRRRVLTILGLEQLLQ
jgi:colanic acid/amylovoran biosynthesis glycosyltransferase